MVLTLLLLKLVPGTNKPDQNQRRDLHHLLSPFALPGATHDLEGQQGWGQARTLCCRESLAEQGSRDSWAFVLAPNVSFSLEG